MTKPRQVKPLDQQIEEYKNHQNFKPYMNQYNNDIYKPAWNWDDAWDGQLIKDVLALEQVGFTVVSFSRKRKVTLKTDRISDLNLIQLASGNTIAINERAVIVDTIIDAVGDSWYSISFKPTLSIYWKGRSSSWRY